MSDTNTTPTGEQVKERPILFSAPMIRAILSGKKTQTRRIVKPQPKPFKSHDNEGPFVCFQIQGWPEGRILESALSEEIKQRCPYGKPGDRLWVRETWGTFRMASLHQAGFSYRTGYRADFPSDYDGFGLVDGWKPSIHMFRADSRILLEVADVRVERLQAISEADAIAEGIERTMVGGFRDYELPDGVMHAVPAEYSYQTLWDKINGKGAWDLNPFVWVVTFRVIEPAQATASPSAGQAGQEVAG